MNLESIKAARDEVAELLASFDKIIAFHEGVSAALVRTFPPAALPLAPVQPERRIEAAPEQASSPRRRNSRRTSGLGQAIKDWVATRTTMFKLEDLPEALRADRTLASKALSNLKQTGVLGNGGYGIYVPPVPKAGAAAAPVRTVTAEVGNHGKPVLEGRESFKRVAQAASYIIGLHGGKSLSARTLIEECKGLWPELVDTPNRESDFRVALITAKERGLLVRIGVGPDALYTKPIG